MNTELLRKYSGAVPRYTSYPTAPHFHEGIDNGTYRRWLGELGHRNRISLYLHIPYCDRLCWFCACHTKHTLKYEPIAVYLEALKREIAAVGSLVSPDAVVSAVHFGGGSPTMLRPEDMVGLMDCLRRHFTFGLAPEISVEMDPNDLDESRYDALAVIGMTRASLGVQDFDDKVQKTINRIQTFEQTESVVDAVRARGVHSVNCDILYGLPFQTCETLQQTVDQIISLDPDRIALFGYAHVPWMKKHQSLIPEQALPDIAERYRQMTMAAEMLSKAGYRAIGIDHFAKPADTLSRAVETGELRRNFQGYTTDTADALIGLGASAIGRLPQGYVQNMVATGEYQRMVGEGGFAVLKGIELSEEDHLRSYVIERLMCDFSLDLGDLKRRFGKASHSVSMEAQLFAGGDRDGVVRMDGDVFAVTEAGKPFVRHIAATFDAYLGSGRGRHSVAV
ncbi:MULTISPECIES: oxygen-independent coproporphyrinogen III oxidase [Rhizobium/Agrobacterium group]|uniref:oxygen-independent coproporphyrinogen III oxidase n=1 Tax=Rhizobium/Agrobacterium group TaxID=227290 RepID=UPI0003F20B43|nr:MULTISPECIES: oxygen-independent coproporphyrinogen III oxidase [Rhizobium/Agrobacterium group]AHK01449.1 coproporphyrinogen III oxidase, oxygen-independent [Agrobacterium tumefaciens LBA4213 (Ach5)]AKC07309.1 oxygen-independent coproporphyrinogen III oxidase [Agrobacterium tumefaciens]AYM16149.1 oxygen-independent coproporphyrinogen III oxidase [Agrobacterium tumefaciens]AYM67450.1 oxygen-independent coproporphyrinogen III oxidase [Agrobacterium tumefaciens]NIB55039.1 oxygen-independent co